MASVRELNCHTVYTDSQIIVYSVCSNSIHCLSIKSLTRMLRIVETNNASQCTFQQELIQLPESLPSLEITVHSVFQKFRIKSKILNFVLQYFSKYHLPTISRYVCRRNSALLLDKSDGVFWIILRILEIITPSCWTSFAPSLIAYKSLLIKTRFRPSICTCIVPVSAEESMSTKSGMDIMSLEHTLYWLLFQSLPLMVTICRWWELLRTSGN
jgi:hypothetical protein